MRYNINLLFKGESMYIIIHKNEDGEIEMGCCKNMDNAKYYIDNHKLQPEDYAVIEGGNIRKDFFNVTW